MMRDGKPAEEAASWVNRLDQPVIDTSAGAAFDRWMASDPRNRDTFADLQALWHSDALTQALQQVDAEPANEDDEVADAPSPRSRSFSNLALAAACAALLMAVPLFLGLASTTYRTGLGDGQSILLADGSHVDLSGNSELEVRILPWRRSATLVRGEAFFDVRHEGWRPFLVQSGTTSVRVLGTAFNVDRQSATRTAVQVYRGAVSVEAPRVEALVLHKGEKARVVDDRIEAPAAPERRLPVHRSPDWKSGWFEAADVPLSVLIAKVQRYSAQPIRLSDPALAAMPVSGRFQVSEPRRVLQAIRAAYELDVSFGSDAILVSGTAEPAKS